MDERPATLTPTEQRMFDLLAKGEPVRRDQLKMLTNEGDYCTDVNLRVHISNLRRKIADPAITIMAVCDPDGWTYRIVRRLSSPYDGVK